MPVQATKIRVFVASPSDVAAEREALDRVIDQINRTAGHDRGLVLELLKWETHAVPDTGRPQAVVIRTVGPYDVMIGIMWKHFGTPTGKAESGTEEEFQAAYDSWQRHGRPRILFYFNETPYVLRTVAETQQLAKVLRFRDKLRDKALFWTYSGIEQFEVAVRTHLYRVVTEIESSTDQDSEAQVRLAKAQDKWEMRRDVADDDLIAEIVSSPDSYAVNRSHAEFLVASTLMSRAHRPSTCTFGFSQQEIRECCRNIVRTGPDDVALRAIWFLSHGDDYNFGQPLPITEVDILLTVAADDNRDLEVRTAALDAFWFKKMPPSLHLRAVELASALLSRKKPSRLRRNAVRMLRSVRTQASYDVLIKCIGDSNADVRRETISSLLAHPEHVASSELYQWLLREASGRVQREIVRDASGLLGTDAALPFLRRVARERDLSGELRGIARDEISRLERRAKRPNA